MKNASGILLALNEPVFELDLEGRVVSATTSADTFAGKTAGVTGYAITDIVGIQERQRFEQSLKRIAEGKTSSATVEATIRADATGDASIPIEFKMAAMTGANGKPTGIGVWLRDLSFEKANEDAANVQGTHLLDLVENVSDACVVEGADGTIEMLNNTFCLLFKITEAPQSMVGTSCATLFEAASVATEKRIGPIYFPLDASGGSNQHDELEFQLVTGETVVQASLAVDNESRVAGRMHLFHLKVARHLSRSDDENPSSGMAAKQMALIEKIARDLAVALDGASSAVLRGEQLDLPSQVLNHFRRVENAATSAFDSVAGLLDFSRIEGGTILLDSGTFSLRESIAVMLAGTVSHAEHAGVQLRVRIEQDVPDAMIGDGPRLILAIRNLIDCALLSMPPQVIPTDSPSEIALTISPEYASAQKIHLAFSIEYTNRSTSARPKALPPSAMMQLALARQIVRALVDDKSKIDTRERKNGVSYAFTAAFPFDAVNPPNPRPTFVTLTGLPALIVSKNIGERKQLADLMKGWRMHPREADNPTMALELLVRLAKEDNPIPLVITSNELPIQDGFLLAFRIKQHPKLKQTAVIMLAATGKPGDAITCRENGISAYLRQPIAPQQLNEAISAIMGSQESTDTTDTLITRHSLRESKKASVLIIDSARDQAMFAVGGLKKRGFRVVLVGNDTQAFEAMGQEEFDVIVVDPTGTNFGDANKTVAAIRRGTGADRPMPKILLASETPLVGPTPYDGMVLKPYLKGSLVDAVGNVLPQHPAGRP